MVCLVGVINGLVTKSIESIVSSIDQNADAPEPVGYWVAQVMFIYVQ